jgi:glycosyltransferase involved in cell wall biosynthesis
MPPNASSGLCSSFRNIDRARMYHKGSLCILPVHRSVGGPASFQDRLCKGLSELGVETHHDITRPGCAAVLVVAGTSRLDRLFLARRRGIHIVQRLGGINWTHRQVHTGLKHYLRATWYNWIQAYIRRNLANAIVYQSNFASHWWQEACDSVSKPISVIYNGVDLALFRPDKPITSTTRPLRILTIEGSYGGGYEIGFQNAVQYCLGLQAAISAPIQLTVVGRVPPSLRSQYATHPWIEWAGVVQRTLIPEWHARSHLYFACDVRAACPNAVIESMACGTPVVGYDTGAIRELIAPAGGCVASYGAADDRLQPAVPGPLVQASLPVLSRLPEFRRSARQRAVEKFDVQEMVARYLELLFV